MVRNRTENIFENTMCLINSKKVKIGMGENKTHLTSEDKGIFSKNARAGRLRRLLLRVFS
jgi:hypothetical protein